MGELWGNIKEGYFDEMSAGNSRPGGKIKVAEARHTQTHTICL